jgi:hypothetical protein
VAQDLSNFVQLSELTFEQIMTETEARLNSHEAVCALRYEQINARLKRLEGILIKACGAMLLGMAGVIYSSITYLK